MTAPSSAATPAAVQKPRRRRRPPLTWWQWLLCWAVTLIPPILLSISLLAKLERDLNAILAQAAPIASAEVSLALGREVRIGRLSPDLSVRGLIRDYRRREALGTIRVAAEDVVVANGPSLSADGELAAAERVSAYIAIPRLLAGHANESVVRILVETPRLLLVRNKDGRFNVQELVKPSQKPPGAPFLTVVEVTGGAVRFVDFAAKVGKLPQVNYLASVEGTADLGERAYRFEVGARAQRATTTANRLRGALAAEGALARGMPGTRTDAPDAETARFNIRATAADADAAYWMPYFIGPQPAIGLRSGRADVELTVAAPRPKLGAPQPSPTPSVVATAGTGTTTTVALPPADLGISAVFRQASAVPASLKVPVRDASGTVRFRAGVLGFDVRGLALDQPVTASGALWNLGPYEQKPGGAPPPQVQLAVAFDAPRIPVRQTVALFGKFPEGISVDGLAGARGFVTGTPANPVVRADARVPRVRVRNLPPLTDVSARLAFSQGLLGITGARASVGGGQLSGRAAARLGEAVRNAEGVTQLRLFGPEKLVATFSGGASDVPLILLERLAGADSTTATQTDVRLRLAGVADAQVVGRWEGGALTAAADVAARGLRVGDIPFTTATARVLANKGRYAVSQARLDSPAGTVSVSGDVSEQGALDLRFSSLGLDLGRLARAFLDRRDVSGLVTATGSVRGTVSDPRIVVERTAGLNLRYGTYAIDSVTAEHIVVTRQAVTFTTPVAVRRFPAEASISGRVTQLGLGGTAGTGNRPATPQLDLTVQVSDLDYNEVLQQLPARAAAATAKVGATALAQVTAGTERPGAEADSDQPMLAATVRQAAFRVRGPVTAPEVNGTATLGRLLVGPYPIDRGWVDFAYKDGTVRLTDVRLVASVGTITAQATIDRKGEVSGAFQAGSIDLEPLSFLTQKFATIGGSVALSGTFSGTQRRPVVTLNIAPSTVTVAGTTLTNVSATGLRYIANLEADYSRIEAPRLGFEQGGTKVAVTGVAVDLRTRRFSAVASVETGDIGVLLGTLRRSNLSDTPAAARFLETLNQIPSPLSGRFAINRVAVAGRLDNGKVEDLVADADIDARNLTVGNVVVSSLDLNASARGNVITLGDPKMGQPGLTLVSEETTIRAGGSVDLDGDMDVTVDSNAFSLDLVRSFLPVEDQAGFPLTGTVELTARATGKTRTPQVDLNLLGRNIRVSSGTATPDPAKAIPAAAADAASRVAQNSANQEPKGILLSLVRINADLAPTGTAIPIVNGDGEKTGDYTGPRLTIRDTLIQRDGGGHIDLEGVIPFSYEPLGIVAGGPVSLVATLQRQSLSGLLGATLPSTEQAANVAASAPATNSAAGTPEDNLGAPVTVGPGYQIGGVIGGNIALGGTLREPLLSGSLEVSNGRLRLPQQNGRDPFNPISDFDATINLQGADVVFKEFRVALGGPNGDKGDFGALTVSGGLVLQDLQTLLGRLVRSVDRSAQTERTGAAVAGAFGTNSTLNLTIRADKLRPVEQNLSGAVLGLVNQNNTLGLGEAFRSTINGTVTITGPLRTPRIATPANSPIMLRDTRIQMPTETGQPGSKTGTVAFNPSFDLRAEVDNRATLEGIGLLRFAFDVDGFATIGGSLYDPNSLASQAPRGDLNVQGQFRTIGGFLQYTSFRFVVDKGGRVLLSYVGDAGAITLEDVTARTTVYAPRGVQPSLDTRYRQDAPLAQSTQQVSGRGTRYRITAKLSDSLPLGERAAVRRGLSDTQSEFFDVNFESDPPLTQDQILALIGTKSQIDALARGEVGLALRQGFEQVLQSSILPGVFQPFESQVASLLGLEQFSLEYGPSATPSFFVAKRLPDPLDRFLVGYSQSLRPSAQTAGQPAPYTISLSWDLDEISLSRRYQPRLQIGVSTDEQRNFTGYLRALTTF